MNLIGYFFSGAIVLGFWMIALFFLKFWQQERDRLFAYFSLAFCILGVERLVLVCLETQDESVVYLARVVAFLMIAFGILERNRRRP